MCLPWDSSVPSPTLLCAWGHWSTEGSRIAGHGYTQKHQFHHCWTIKLQNHQLWFLFRKHTTSATQVSGGVCLHPTRHPLDCWAPSQSLATVAEPRDCRKARNKGIRQQMAADGHGWDWTRCLIMDVTSQAGRIGLRGHIGLGVSHFWTCLTHKAQHKGCKLQAAPSFRECLFRLLQGLKSQSTNQGSCLCLNTQELPSYKAWERKGRAGHSLQVICLACPKHKWCMKSTAGSQQWLENIALVRNHYTVQLLLANLPTLSFKECPSEPQLWMGTYGYK